MSHKSNYDIHHKIPQVYKKEFEHPSDINDANNKQKVKKPRHVHHHWEHWADTPAMSMMSDVINNLSVLEDGFAKDILKVFQKHFWNYYIYETHIQAELWRLLELEDAFRNKRTHDPTGKNNTKMKK